MWKYFFMWFDGKWRSSSFETLNVLKHSAHERDPGPSVCISDVYVAIDPLSGDSLKESDSIKDKVTFRSSPNRTSVLDPSIFRISVPFLFNYQIFLQSIAENDKKWPKYPDYLFSHNCGQLNYIWLEKLQQYLGFIRNNSC